MQLADLIGSEPVQYGSIKAIALADRGRYDAVTAAIDQEVTDDEHPFGQAIASLARSVYLTRLTAWEPAAVSLADTLERAEALSRVWMQDWAHSMLAVVDANLRVAGLAPADNTRVESGRDERFGGSMAGLVGAEIALVEGRLDDVLSLTARYATRAPDAQSQNRVRALDLIAQAQLATGDLEAAAEAAGRALPIAESMQFGSLLWRLRMVRAIALGESTEQATAEFRTVADRIPEPELRSWFERQALAPR